MFCKILICNGAILTTKILSSLLLVSSQYVVTSTQDVLMPSQDFFQQHRKQSVETHLIKRRIEFDFELSHFVFTFPPSIFERVQICTYYVLTQQVLGQLPGWCLQTTLAILPNQPYFLLYLQRNQVAIFQKKKFRFRLKQSLYTYQMLQKLQKQIQPKK